MHNRKLPTHVFSEGAPDDFDELMGSVLGEVTLHLNGDPTEAFNALASARVLITSRSGFSYLAGIVNSHLKIAPPFWHHIPDADGWIQATLDGEFELWH